jgi:hypothetical protein
MINTFKIPAHNRTYDNKESPETKISEAEPRPNGRGGHRRISLIHFD